MVHIGPDNRYGQENLIEFQHNLKRFRVDYRFVTAYWPKLNTRDYSPFISSILRDNPDVLVIGLYAGDFREFIRQGNLRKLFSRTIACKFIAGGHYENFSDSKDEVPLGMYFSGSNFLNWPDTETKRNFVEKIRHSTGEYPSVVFEDFYSAVHLLAKAIEEAGNPHDTKALIKAM